jgi:hypothetical protein
MPNYSYYKELAEEEEGSQGPATQAGESPAASWISRVEDPNSVVNQYGTEYSGAEAPAASARGTIQRPERNVDQWGNESPVESRTTKMLSSVYRTLSNWRQYLGGAPKPENSPYVNPQWGKENIRTVRDVMGQAPAKSVGMK